MINRSFFALFLATCGIMLSVSARAQVSVSSHTSIEILNNQKRIVPSCQTLMLDTTTKALYLSASVLCTLNQNGGAIQTLAECAGTPLASCNAVLGIVIDGATYQTTARHGVIMQLLQPGAPAGTCPPSTGLASCFWDPLSYGLAQGAPIPPTRVFNDNGLVPFSNTQSFWNTVNGADSLIATTAETPFHSAQVFPVSLRAKAKDTRTFTLNGGGSAIWTFIGSGGTTTPPAPPTAPAQGDSIQFNAPSTVPVPQTDTLTACKVDQSHGMDCNTAQITVEVLGVSIPPADYTANPPTNPDELLGGEKIKYNAITTQGGREVPFTVQWTKISETSGGNFVDVAPDGTVTVHPQTEFQGNNFDVDIQATNLIDPDVAKSGIFTIHIPTVTVKLTPPFPGVNEPPFEASENRKFRFVATVTGPVQADNRLVTWGQKVLTFTGNPGAFTFPGPDGDTTDYQIPSGSPPTQAVTVTISACVGGTVDAFGDPVDEICDTFPLSLVPPPHPTSAAQTINSGESTLVTVTGTGFGAAPIFSFSDPTVTFTQASVSGPDANGVTTVTGTMTAAPVAAPIPFTFPIIPVTITSSLPPPSTPVNQNVFLRPVTTSAAVTPVNPTLLVSQSQQFTPSLGCLTSGGQSCTVPQTSTCSLFTGPGTMTTSCLYTAPASLAAQTQVQGRVCFTFGNACTTFPITLAPVAVSVSPAAVSPGPGQSQQFQATVTNVPSNNQGVTWSINPLVGTITAAGLYTAPALISAAQTITVTACSTVDSSQCGSATVTLVPPDFQISVAQSTGLSSPFSQNGFNLTVTPIGAFTGNVILSATLPAGIGMSSVFSPPTITGSGTSVATFPVLASTPVGTYPVTITATSGGLAHSVQITVTVAQPTLSIVVSPPQTVSAGQTVQYTFTVSWSVFFGSTSVNVTGIPPGSSWFVVPGTFFSPGPGTLTLTTPTNLATGNYNLTFTATGGGLVSVGSSSLNVGLTATQSTTLTISEPPPPPPPPPGGCTTRICLDQ